MSKINWSTAPEGAELWADGDFFKWNGIFTYMWGDGRWEQYVDDFSERHSFEQRPAEWPTETRIDIIGTNGNTGEAYMHYDEQREQHEAKHDPVNNPKHYAIAPSIEAIDIIKASLTPEQFKGYLLGNFLKYRLRAGDKGDLQQDIDKSNWYRERLNALREAGK